MKEFMPTYPSNTPDGSEEFEKEPQREVTAEQLAAVRGLLAEINAEVNTVLEASELADRFASDEFVTSWVEYGLLSANIPLQEIRM